MRKLGEFLFLNQHYAAAAAFLFSLLPFFGLPTTTLATIVVVFMVLCRGVKIGFFVLAWAALPGLVFLVASTVPMADKPFEWIVMSILFISFLFGVLLKSGFRWVAVLYVSLLLGIFVVVISHAMVPDMAAWWIKQLSPVILALTQQTGVVFSQRLLSDIAPMMTGIMVVSSLATLWLILILAKQWQNHVFQIDNPNNRLSAIHLHPRTALLTVLVIVFGYVFHDPVLVDATPVWLFYLAVPGLSLLHFFIRKRQTLWPVLLVSYLGIFFVPEIMIPLMSLAGLVDAFFHFRSTT